MKFPNPFRSHQSDFLEMLAKQAQETCEGMETLELYVKEGDEVYARRLEAIEKEADELRHILIDQLNRSFVTPIDREDLFTLSRTIDDVLDYGFSTVDEMVTLGIKPNAHLQRLVSFVHEEADELYLAVTELKDHPHLSLDHAGRAKALENRTETEYRAAVADLFKQAKTVEDVVEILKTREVYRHLSNAADRGDEAANILGDIVVKMT